MTARRTAIAVIALSLAIVVAAVVTGTTTTSGDASASPPPSPGDAQADDPVAAPQPNDDGDTDGREATAQDEGTTEQSDDAATADVPMRPDGPTGKGRAGAPAFDGQLTAAQIPVIRDAPELEQIDGWLQADGVERLDDARSDVTVVQFWTFSCNNCTATLPHLQALRDAHGDELAIVGVHSPEFSFEEDPAAVADAAAELGVTWPIALDTGKRSFHSWQEGRSGFWPRTYVIDAEGRIRFDHVGEGRYEELAATVDALLDEQGGTAGWSG